MSHPVPDLFSPDSVNDGIHRRWSQTVGIGQQDMDVEWDVMSKPLSEDREDPRSIKEDDDTDVGATSIESFATSIAGWDVEDSTENQHIGNKN